MTYCILVINPNSSEKVSENLARTLTAPPQVELEFYTAPGEAPREIDGEMTSQQSANVVLPDLLGKGAVERYDGFLVGCYSDHPLIHSLAQHTRKPILGIMQATLLYSLSNPSLHRSFVLTSFSSWEPLLDRAIVDFVGGASGDFPTSKFQRTRALDVSVLDLADPDEFAKIRSRVENILTVEYASDNIDCVLLGCAGMAGLDAKLSHAFPGIHFIDSCKIGVEFLSGLVRFSSTTH